MKAIVLHEYGGPDKLKYEDAPDPTPAAGEVLVRVSATSVNPIDYKIRSGAYKDRFPVQFPEVLGRDVTGIVHTLGEGVTGFQPGDRVFALANHCYAELCAVKATDLALLPEGLDIIHAAALPLVCTTGSQLITDAARVQPGETVLITGALGSVGRVAVHTARKLGAKVIAGVRKSQLKQAEELGADSLLALDDKDAVAALGFMDSVADTVGGPPTEPLLGKVKQGGNFGTVAQPPTNAAQHPTVHVTRIMAKPDPAGLIALAKDTLTPDPKAGKLVIPIDRMLPLDETAAAQTAAEKGGIGKVLLLA